MMMGIPQGLSRSRSRSRSGSRSRSPTNQDFRRLSRISFGAGGLKAYLKGEVLVWECFGLRILVGLLGLLLSFSGIQQEFQNSWGMGCYERFALLPRV